MYLLHVHFEVFNLSLKYRNKDLVNLHRFNVQHVPIVMKAEQRNLVFKILF